MRRSSVHGVGLGWRQEIASELLVRRELVDFIEVIAETCFAQSSSRREAVALAETWAVIPHGVKLSLGSAEGIDEERAKRLGTLARELRAPMITEHVALTSAGGCEIGHLTQLPRTREAVAVVARNVERARRHLPDVPFVLENVAWTLRWPGDDMREEDFYCEVARATGCPMLLDIGNLYANALNEGRDALEVLKGCPLDRVAMVHIAGGHVEDGFFFDDHASPVAEGVFGLLGEVVKVCGPVPVLLERDANFPPFGELMGELKRVRDLSPQPSLPAGRGGGGSEYAMPSMSSPSGRASPDTERGMAGAVYARTQAALARVLSDRRAEVGVELAGFRADEIARTREVLQRKRVDDALPLLKRLTVHGPRLAELARDVVDSHARPPRGAALSDAWRIATAAGRDERMAADARVDLLVLRARFQMPTELTGVPGPRVGPFVGSARARSGRRVWALKGVGANAAVRLVER